MTTVPDRILKWLYESLRSEYHDPDRTYSDIAQTLSRYPSLSPRTDIYTFENGASALLLVLRGTIPVSFRGTTYRFPIELWVPQSYPKEAPIIYVTPTQDMRVRPGQHVSQEGRIFHPYLAGWANHWRVSSIVDFLSVLSDVFAKEPPVISMQHHAQLQRAAQVRPATNTPPPPPRPPPPQDLQRQSQQMQSAQNPSSQPPARPPKALEGDRQTESSTSTRSTGPPLPPKPGSTEPVQTGRAGNGHVTSPGNTYLAQSSSMGADKSRSGPPLPPLPAEVYGGSVDRAADPRRSSTQIRTDEHRGPWDSSYYPPQTARQNTQQQIQPPYHVAYQSQGFPSQSTLPQQPTPQSQVQASKKISEPTPDLLTSTFDIPIPTNSTPAPPPPIPPNPEKDALINVISTSLIGQLQQNLSQTAAALPSLDAQHNAMLQALQNMQAEQAQLSQLSEVLSSNERILRESMREADRVMDGVKTRELPSVDEVLVAPTIVAEQLYNLVAEERGIEDAMFALGRAVGAGRIGGDVFVKQTRSLAREQFLKKALIKKIAKGMGLNLDFGIIRSSE